MNCDAVQERLGRHVDGDLAESERVEVERHLVTCAACAGELAELRRTVRLVESLEEVPVGPDFTVRVMAAVRALPEAQPTSPRWWPVGLVLGLGGFVLTAAVLLGVLVTGPSTVSAIGAAARPVLGIGLEWGRAGGDVLSAVWNAAVPSLARSLPPILAADLSALVLVWLAQRRLAIQREAASIPRPAMMDKA